MKFTLKDYQDEAVRDVLDRLVKARKRWKEDRDPHGFSLTATTGAGKTVMAAAVFEALFHGDDNYEFEADPGAVVLWFSDDPSLNEQTRFRLLEASDRLNSTDLIVVQNTFNQVKFEPGKVYFLNTQKLGKKSLLVRGHDPDEEEERYGRLLPETRPDLRSFTIWDTIQNTIDDPDLTLYLALDEAHRGMKEPTSADRTEKTTIVRRLINGSGAVPPMPIVLGISATIERFNKAMEGAQNRTTMPSVLVDSAKVQESGLLKDTIILDVPEGVGSFETVLVRRATDKIKELSEAWGEYAEQQGSGDAVKPLMVLQVPNTPNPDDIGAALDTIYERWPDLAPDAVAHVFGEHTTQTFGRHTIPYISPERVQESTHIRVLIAKDAISTGWDCPRAEVMVSFRPAQDRTHITQLLGRMVRTPLARRIPGNDRLNSVDCLLPLFDKATVERVANALMEGSAAEGDTGLTGRRVLINPVEMLPNPAISQDVWDSLLALPSQALPQKGARAIKRLTLLAHELAVDDLLKDAGKLAHAEMHKALDAAQVRYAPEIKEARQAVMTVEGSTVTADLGVREMTFDYFVEAADFAVIEDAYRRSARVLSPDIARTYAEHLAKKNTTAGNKEDALMEAHTDIAALGLVPDIRIYIDDEAEKLTKKWLTAHRVSIKGLNDERQEAYRQVQMMSTDPQDIDLAQPKSWMEATTAREADGSETPLPVYTEHLMSDDQGKFPAELNTLEQKILQTEFQRSGFKAWYRNPSHPSQDSFGIAYEQDKRVKIVRPDFIFFSEQSDGTIVADLIDPHGTHLADSLPKAQGMAKYVESHPKAFRRFELVDEIDGQIKVLDLTKEEVREAVLKATELKPVYTGSKAMDYQ